MSKRLLYIAPVAALSVVMVLPFLSDRQVVFTSHTETRADGTPVQVPRMTTLAQLRARQEAPGPRVRVDAPVHDFGRLDPLTVHQHAFVIRNVGDAPLELTEGPTTCKCTLSKLHQGAVPPGGQTTVVLQWNTGRDESYAHSATVYTNDPRNRSVQLRIEGTVQTLLRCSPDRLVFSRVNPGETLTATTVLYSHVWDEMELEPIVPPIAGMVCTVEEATAEEQAACRAQSARRICVTLPSDLPEGYFHSPVVLRAKPRGGPAEQVTDCELPVEGKVIRRLSVYGPEIEVDGTVDLGRVRQGNPLHVRLMLKVRDPQRQLPVQRMEVTPGFLGVRVEPVQLDQPEDKELGLYYLHIDVPKDAPTFRLPPTKLGAIHIEFDHPRIPALDLPVDLIVTPRDGI